MILFTGVWIALKAAPLDVRSVKAPAGNIRVCFPKTPRTRTFPTFKDPDIVIFCVEMFPVFAVVAFKVVTVNVDIVFP
jgi:hypothetical protein